MARYFVNESGAYVGAFDGGIVTTIDENGNPVQTPVFPVIPPGLTEVPTAPAYVSDTWNGSAWVPNPTRLAEEARKASIKSDPVRVALLAQLKSATNTQIENYVNNRVTNLATAKDILIDILKLIALDSRNGS